MFCLSASEHRVFQVEFEWTLQIFCSKTTRWNSDPYNVIQVDTGTVG